ncbi:MAG: YeaC family protein [Colwellia sp.]|nr:YeaC family protein [Colwellia sp.]
MELLSLVDNMTEEMYLRLKCAAETGKWPEGTVVAKEQKESALQIIMAYQARHLNSDDMLSIGPDGEIVSKTKSFLRSQFKQAAKQATDLPSDHNTIARFPNL